MLPYGVIRQTANVSGMRYAENHQPPVPPVVGDLISDRPIKLPSLSDADSLFGPDEQESE